jgi:hypothetical protein
MFLKSSNFCDKPAFLDPPNMKQNTYGQGVYIIRWDFEDVFVFPVASHLCLVSVNVKIGYTTYVS